MQTHGIADNTAEKKGDLFAMSVLISRRQRGSQMRQHLVKRRTRARSLIGFDRRRDRVLGAFKLSRQSGNDRSGGETVPICSASAIRCRSSR